MKLDLWTRLMFLIIPLAINVTAVENIKDSGQPESLNGSWFTNWRRTRTKSDLKQERTPSFISTTPLIHPLLSEQKHTYQQSKSLVIPMKSYSLESTPAPVQLTAALNIEPMVAAQTRILKLISSNDKGLDTINTDVKTTNDNPKPLSTIKTTERTILSSTVPDVTSTKPSYTELEHLSDLVSVNRSINYYQVEHIGATSSSSPQIVPYGLSTSLSKSMLLISQLYGYSCATSKGYYKYGDSCDQFVECKEFVASLYKCSPGHQFNRNADYGEAPCTPSSIIRCERSVQPQVEPTFSGFLISNPLANFICPTHNGYYRLGTDCNKFIRCEQFAASLYKCLSGLEFNAKAGANEDPCAVPAVARCKREVIIQPKSALLIDPNLEDYRCTEANGYFGIDNNCERFVECKMFVPSLFMCPNGLLFNRQAAWGVDPCSSSVRCEIKSTPLPIEQPPQKKSYIIMLMQVPGYFCSVANGYFSVKDKCDHFIMCKKNVASLNICNPGLHFKRNASWEADPCTDPATAQCQLSGKSLKKPSVPVEPDIAVGHCPRWRGYFPLDNTECSKYIRCEYGRAIIMPCPLGLVFNAELEACDWPVNVPSCNPDVFHGFTCPTPEMTEDGIPSEKIFKFRYRQSCTKYIACQAGRPRLLTCDFGLAFSLESQKCIQRDLVDCKE